MDGFDGMSGRVAASVVTGGAYRMDGFDGMSGRVAASVVTGEALNSLGMLLMTTIGLSSLAICFID